MNSPKPMPEEFLQYIWQHRLFDSSHLKTTHGEAVRIIDPGKLNPDSGPDFFNARVKIGRTLWAGNVEIHRKASDWLQHNHHNDNAYKNVILHVVEINDLPELNREQEIPIPTIEITFPEVLQQNYQRLLNARTWIACQDQFHRVNPVVLQLAYNRLMIERLEHKTMEIKQVLQQNQNDWNESFYQFLARSFGFKINALPFQLLAQAIPLKILQKHRNRLFQIEALLFGTAGLLNSQLLGDDYFLHLRQEYSFLYHKYQLKPIEQHLWKFMRLRPANFPTIRIAQLAALIHKTENLFSKLTECTSIEQMKSLFAVKPSSYWRKHYNFNKATPGSSSRKLGETAMNLILINIAIPFLFVYGENQNKPELQDKVLDFLDQLPAEENSIITKWQKLGLNPRSAFESQALLQLKNNHCEQKKCLYCPVGSKLLSQ